MILCVSHLCRVSQSVADWCPTSTPKSGPTNRDAVIGVYRRCRCSSIRFKSDTFTHNCLPGRFVSQHFHNWKWTVRCSVLHPCTTTSQHHSIQHHHQLSDSPKWSTTIPDLTDNHRFDFSPNGRSQQQQCIRRRNHIVCRQRASLGTSARSSRLARQSGNAARGCGHVQRLDVGPVVRRSSAPHRAGDHNGIKEPVRGPRRTPSCPKGYQKVSNLSTQNNQTRLAMIYT